MTKLSNKEIKLKLKMAFWDYTINPEDLFDVFTGKKKHVGSIDCMLIYSRLLNSFDWYTLLKIVPPQKWKVMLSDKVLDFIYPKSLKNKYAHARKLLFE
jgi:hypothetical protein